MRDNAAGVRRLVSSLRGLRVVLVEDGLLCPTSEELRTGDCVGMHCDVEVLRNY